MNNAIITDTANFAFTHSGCVEADPAVFDLIGITDDELQNGTFTVEQANHAIEILTRMSDGMYTGNIEIEDDAGDYNVNHPLAVITLLRDMKLSSDPIATRDANDDWQWISDID